MSSQSAIPFFGRAWQLTITPNQGPSAGIPIVVSSHTFEPEALRIEFEVTQQAYIHLWEAVITIYNANGPISEGPSAGVNLYQTIIQEGDMITLCAGYQADVPPNANPPIIWNGPIFYTIQDRVDVVDQRLILHCLINRALTLQNFLNTTLPARSTQFSQAQAIAQNSTVQIGIDEQQLQTTLNNVRNSRGATQLPRAKSYFGNPHHYLAHLAAQNDLVAWFDETKFNLDSLKLPVGPIVGTYAPVHLLGSPPSREGDVNLTLIGQPTQTQYGADFRILLDPVVQVKAPLRQVAVQKQYIKQAPFTPQPTGDKFPPLPLVDQYVVVGVKITGDTRGNPWYTDITGIAQILTAIQLLGHTGTADPMSN